MSQNPSYPVKALAKSGQVVATIHRRFLPPYGTFGNWGTAHLSVGGQKYKVITDVSCGFLYVYEESSATSLYDAIVKAALTEKEAAAAGA